MVNGQQLGNKDRQDCQAERKIRMRNLGGRVQNTLGPTNQAATNQIYTVKDIQNQRKLKSPKAQRKIKRNRLSNKSQCDQYNEFLAFKSLCFYLEVGLQPKRKPVTDDIFYTQLFFFLKRNHTCIVHCYLRAMCIFSGQPTMAHGQLVSSSPFQEKHYSHLDST